MMNELLAIILIVLLCCFLFFAWLFALATCPDRMVNLISGTKQSSSSPISRASEDLLGGGDEKPGDDATGDEEEENGGGKGDKRVLVDRPASKNGRPPHLLVRSRSIPSSRSAGLLAQLTSDKRSNSKKLSVVPEADEQLTVTSISQCLRPPHLLSNNFGGTPRSPTASKELPQQLLSAVKTVLLNRNPSNRSAVSTSVVDVEEGGGTGGDGGGGGEASSSARSSKIETDDEKEEQEESDGKQQPTEENVESKNEMDKKKEDQQQQKSQQSPQQKSSAEVSINEVDEEEDGQEQEQLAVLARRSAPPAIHLV